MLSPTYLKWRGIVPFLLLLGIAVSSKAQLVVTDFIPPDNTQPELVICGQPATFTIELVGDEAEDIELALDMTFGGMTGIQYIPNSFMPALSEDATNPQQPIFQIGDLSATQIITFQAEDGIRDCLLSRGLGDVYKRQSW